MISERFKDFSVEELEVLKAAIKENPLSLIVKTSNDLYFEIKETLATKKEAEELDFGDFDLDGCESGACKL